MPSSITHKECREALLMWNIQGVVDVEDVTGGAVNETVRVGTHDNPLVLQRLRGSSDQVAAMEHNLQLIQDRGCSPFVPFLQGDNGAIVQHCGGHPWRVSLLIPGKVISAIDQVPYIERQGTCRKLGEVFGRFFTSTRDISEDLAKEVIPRYRDSRYHLDYLTSILGGEEVPLSLSTNSEVRVRLLGERYTGARHVVEEALSCGNTIRLPKVAHPRRFCHGDPKLNNLITGDDGRIWICDPDTMQHEYGASDLYELLRWVANLLGKHPDPNFSSVEMMELDISSAQAAADGFLDVVEEAEGTTERNNIASTAFPMLRTYILNQLLRDLADYLVGDRYYNNTGYPEYIGLYRAKVMLRLLQLVEEQGDFIS